MSDVPPSPETPPAGHACAQCGAPQDEHQQICVECGTPVPRDRRGRWLGRGLPTTALALLVALVIASAAYGLSMDLNSGPDGARPRVAAGAPGPAPAPPAPPAGPVAAAPPGSTPAKPVTPPPASAAAKPAAPAAPAPPAGSAAAAAGNSASTGGSASGSSVGAKPHRHTSSKTHHSSQPSSIAQGDSPFSATLYDPFGDGDEHSGTTGRAVDGKLSTAWTTANHPGGLGKAGVGLVLDTGGYQSWSAIGIQTNTPGFDVSIYSTARSTPPADGPQAAGWRLEGKSKGVARQQKVPVNGATPEPSYYLVWITKLPAGSSHAGFSELTLLR